MANVNTIHITEEEVHDLVDPVTLVQEIREGLADFSSGLVVQPVRSSMSISEHSGTVFSMMAYSPSLNSMAIKLITLYPKAKERRVLKLNLYDPRTAVLLAHIDANHLSELRTAAASVAAIQTLAPRHANVVAILGSGHEARSHWLILSKVMAIRDLRIWSRTDANARKLVGEIGYPARSCGSVKEAVDGAHVIITVTMATQPILFSDWVMDGAHVCSIGATRPNWQEIDPVLMRRAVVYVDSRAGANAESGDVIISGCDIYAEIGEILNGTKKVLAPSQSVTLFKSMGMAIEDVIAGKHVYDAKINKSKL